MVPVGRCRQEFVDRDEEDAYIAVLSASVLANIRDTLSSSNNEFMKPENMFYALDNQDKLRCGASRRDTVSRHPGRPLWHTVCALPRPIAHCLLSLSLPVCAAGRSTITSVTTPFGCCRSTHRN